MLLEGLIGTGGPGLIEHFLGIIITVDVGITRLFEASSYQAGAAARVENACLPMGDQGYKKPTGLGVGHVTQVIDQVTGHKSTPSRQTTPVCRRDYRKHF